MAAWNLARAIDDMFQVLPRDPRIEVLAARREAPVTQVEIDAVHEELGYELDPGFVDFFRVANGLRLVWIDARHESELPSGAEPWERFCEASEGVAAGSIHIPTLRESVLGYAEFDASRRVGEHRLKVLGGWDDALLRRRMRVFDDYENNLDWGSYWLPGLVVDPLYPHPPVLITSDYAADIEGYSPTLARDYLDLVVATLGARSPRQHALDRYNRRRPLFLPTPGWLDDLPSAQGMLDVQMGDGTQADTERVEALLAEPGIDPTQTRWASYIDPSQNPPSKWLADPMDPVRVLSKADVRRDPGESEEHGRVFDALPENLPLLIPVADAHHYPTNHVMEAGDITTHRLQRMIGSMVRLGWRESWRDDWVGCLFGVDRGRIWLYQAGFLEDPQGALHYTHFGFNAIERAELAWIGRALPPW